VKKIPTLFRRDPEDMRRVLPEVTAGCEWVLDGEGVPTRKYDGTCVMLDDDGMWWARREVKPGKAAPGGFVLLGTDPETGKTVGWEPADQSSFAKWLREVLSDPGAFAADITPGTYELCGPKVNGNPEGFDHHVLVYHLGAERLLDVPRDFDGLREWLTSSDFEGIVWHHPDGRMAKLKGRDFR
jgi:hypothetical protein